MARTKTTTANLENHTSPEASSQSPSPNAANDQVSDHSPHNENPVHTVLPDVIYAAFEKPKLQNLSLLKSQSSNQNQREDLRE